MMKSSLAALQPWISGATIAGAAEFSGVSTNSKTVEPGNLFVALRGERFDAHGFLDEVVNRGAAAVLVDRLGRAGRLRRLGARHRLGHAGRVRPGGSPIKVEIAFAVAASLLVFFVFAFLTLLAPSIFHRVNEAIPLPANRLSPCGAPGTSRGGAR